MVNLEKFKRLSWNQYISPSVFQISNAGLQVRYRVYLNTLIFFLRVEIECKLQALIDFCKDSIETNCYGKNLYQGPTNFSLSFLIKSFSNDKQSNLLWISQNLKELLLRSTLPCSMVRCWPIAEFLWISSAFFTTFHVNGLNTCKTFCLVLSYLPVWLWKVFNQYLFVFLVFIALQSCHFLT